MGGARVVDGRDSSHVSYLVQYGARSSQGDLRESWRAQPERTGRATLCPTIPTTDRIGLRLRRQWVVHLNHAADGSGATLPSRLYSQLRRRNRGTALSPSCFFEQGRMYRGLVVNALPSERILPSNVSICPQS